MKSSKLAFALTALFTSCASQATCIVTVKTELIIKESTWGKKIQADVSGIAQKLNLPVKIVQDYERGAGPVNQAHISQINKILESNLKLKKTSK